jgi:protein TonB
MRLAALVVLAVVLAFPAVSSGAQDADRVYTPGKDGVTHPILVKEVKPHYPQAALKEGKSAVVDLECVVTKAGLPTDVRVLKPGDPAFDDEAVKALKQWEFKPGTKDGKPVPVRIEVELTFTAKK